MTRDGMGFTFVGEMGCVCAGVGLGIGLGGYNPSTPPTHLHPTHSATSHSTTVLPTVPHPTALHPTPAHPQYPTQPHLTPFQPFSLQPVPSHPTSLHPIPLHGILSPPSIAFHPTHRIPSNSRLRWPSYGDHVISGLPTMRSTTRRRRAQVEYVQVR